MRDVVIEPNIWEMPWAPPSTVRVDAGSVGIDAGTLAESEQAEVSFSYANKTIYNVEILLPGLVLMLGLLAFWKIQGKQVPVKRISKSRSIFLENSHKEY